jgi:hypothetical protein
LRSLVRNLLSAQVFYLLDREQISDIDRSRSHGLNGFWS